MKDKKIQGKEEINLKLQNKKKVQNLKEKGITLIALVVTIIILLILVGVTISQLSGENGLIRRAKEAVEKYKNASEEELIQLEQYVSDFEIIGENEYKGFALVKAGSAAETGYWTGDLGHSFSVTSNKDIFSVNNSFNGHTGSITILSDIECEIVVSGFETQTGAWRSWSFNGTSISMEELTSKTKLKKDDVITANASTSYGNQADNMVIVIAK